MKWNFSQKRPSDKTRDPVTSEFFSSDAIKNAGEALVREAIQNSLDARIDRQSGRARVRIFVSGDPDALSATCHDYWFESAWPHYLAEKNGLEHGAVLRTSPCKFLVFEDFGTTGLVGDWEQHEEKDGEKNSFFYFFRAEGATGPDKDRLGRWGIGKQVFPRSSKTQTFLGYSETMKNGFLMGGCILKHHSVDGVTFKPDGLFGESKEFMGDELTIPVTDREIIDRFRSDFGLRRQPNETGLSVVVPWIDDVQGEGGGSFDKTALSLAVIEGYFMAILEGVLEVEIENSDGSLKITQGNLIQVLKDLKTVTGENRAKEISKLELYIKLAEDMRSGACKAFELSECDSGKPSLTEDMVPDSLANEVRESLSGGDAVKVVSTLTVRPKDKDDNAEKSEFECYMRKAEGLNEKPCHVREDLIIADVSCSRLPGFACLIRVRRGPLARLLGDSENPAHTEWQKSSRTLKENYILGGVVIEYVANFASNFVRRVYANSRELDRDLLIDLFSDDGPDEESPKRRGKSGDKPVVPDPPVLPPAKPGVRITRSGAGFTVSSNSVAFPLGTEVTVRAAYETTKGNPFRAYRPYDFEFSGSGLKTVLEGGEIKSKRENILTILTIAEKFILHVDGFDVNRDVVVKGTMKVPTDGDGESSEAEGNP